MRKNNFFVINKEAFTKDAKYQHPTLTDEQFEQASEVKWIVREGVIVFDADSKEAKDKIEHLNKVLGIKPYTYETRKDRAHFYYKAPADIQFIINQNKYNSNAKMIALDATIDTRTYNTDNKKTGAIYLKMGNKQKQGRPTPNQLLKNLTNELPEVPLLLLLHKKYGMPPAAGQGLDKYAYKMVGMVKAAGWDLPLVKHLYKEVAKFHNFEYDEEAIVHKWKESVAFALQRKDDEENWRKQLKWKMTGGFPKQMKGEPDEEYVIRREQEWQPEIWHISGVKDYPKLAKIVIEDLKLQISEEDGQVWGLKNGKLQHINKVQGYLKRYIAKEMGNISFQIMGNISNYIEQVIPENDFVKNPFIISFNNKVIDIKKSTMEDVDLPEGVMNQNVIPWNLITEQQLKTTHKDAEKTLDGFLRAWSIARQDWIDQLLENAGLSFTKYVGRSKAMFLVGIGKNGKSWFLKLLYKALGGKDNCSLEDLKELSEDRFSTVNLYCKLANINFDISGSIIADTSIFKKMVSGDPMSGSFKSQDKFRFEPYAKNWFGSNSIPYAKESGDSNGTSRRIEAIPWDNIFEDKGESEIIDMENSLFSKEVIEVFIYKAIQNCHRALNSKFTISAASAKMTDDYVKEINHLFGFIEEQPIVDSEPLSTAHKRYVKWAKEYNFNIFGVKEFMKKYKNALRAKGYETNRLIDDSKSGIARHRVVIRRGGDEE